MNGYNNGIYERRMGSTAVSGCVEQAKQKKRDERNALATIKHTKKTEARTDELRLRNTRLAHPLYTTP